MTKLKLALITLMAVPLSLWAQEEEAEKAPANYVTATYYYCSQAKEEDADIILHVLMRRQTR